MQKKITAVISGNNDEPRLEVMNGVFIEPSQSKLLYGRFLIDKPDVLRYNDLLLGGIINSYVLPRKLSLS